MLGEFDSRGMSSNQKSKHAGDIKDEIRGIRNVDPKYRPENWKRKRV